MVHTGIGNKAAHFVPGDIKAVLPLLERCDAVVLGPGIGENNGSSKFLEKVFEVIKLPTVIDAGALIFLAHRGNRFLRGKQNLILTPHPGEMAKLLGKSIVQVQKDRFQVSLEYAKTQGVHLILKGARTVIAHPHPVPRFLAVDGKNNHTKSSAYQFSINALAGNPGMATAGSGDALSGILAALLGRGITSEQAARWGVLWHAMAGDLGLSPFGGGTVNDLIDAIPRATRSELKRS
jgi:NAD(P)H-hydrate epimerase